MLTVTKLGIAHNLDVKALSPSNVVKRGKTKASNRHRLLYQTPTETSSSTGIPPAQTHHQRAKT
ncbi:hypothetical protein A2U01_0083738, partial [Trifolium medium]|nr:hypothetical protein [Trifolium medium]